MALILRCRDAAKKVQEGDTLASLAAQAGPEIDWKRLARFNWGTAEPVEVLRALVETIGVDLKHLRDKDKLKKPETIPLSPHPDLKAEIRIPELYTADNLDPEKTHVVKVRALKPATAVAILSLDPWFIPEIEECEVKYALSGLKACADKLRVDIFASNYCDCTDWKDGAGAYDKADLEKEPVFVKDGLPADERQRDALKWKGDCSTEKGMLSIRMQGQAKRHVNVAFSPYTVQLTYHKAALPGTDRPQIVLKPFWPSFKLKEFKNEIVNADASERNTNTADRDGGAVAFTDAAGMPVHHEAFTPTVAVAGTGAGAKTTLTRPDALKSGDRAYTWDETYRKGYVNGKMTGEMLDDSAATADTLKTYLYKSTPYKATFTNFVREVEAESLRIGWEMRNTGGKLKRGYVRIKDRHNRTVWLQPLPEAKMADGEHEIAWDGKYPEDIKNTLDGDKITWWDMPYRVEIEAHTPHGETEGLALAAMHSEVRLHTHNETFAASDARHLSDACKPSLRLETGPLMAKAALEGDVALKPGVAPKNQATDEWVRFKLAEAGFHPGPVHKAHDVDFETALREFKRSVPADGAAAPGAFTRLPLDPTNIDLRDGPTRLAIRSLRAGDKRAPYADPAKIAGNDNAPDLTQAEARDRLGDPTQDVAVWVDDRQYYTKTDARDENDTPFLKPGIGESKTDPAVMPRVALGLDDYRGGMVQADNKQALDATTIPRPWLPLRAEPRLMGKGDTLFDAPDAAKITVTDAARRKAIRAALGPLRIDWTFEELPLDVSTIDPAAYPAADFNGTNFWDAKKQMRTRRFVSWEIWRNKADHVRKDDGRKEILTNCPQARGGTRKASFSDYVAETFGTGDQGLWPFKTSLEPSTETVATIVHDLIHKDQEEKTLDKPLVAELVGTACAWFRPSVMGGDGYRVGASVVFEKTADYDFPNLEALKKRYPAPPRAHSAGLRVWRRSSIRGYAYWSDAGASNWGQGMIDRFRDHYKTGHVYFVLESGALAPHNIASIYDPANAGHVTKYKNICSNNIKAGGRPAHYQDVAIMNLDAAHVHPWGARTDLGIPEVVIEDERVKLAGVGVTMWRKYRAGLLMGITKQVEANGFMRGHLFVEFKSSPKYRYPLYQCANNEAHKYCKILKIGEPTPRSAGTCPVAGCGGNLASTGMGYNVNRPLNFPAVGAALGSTWLFETNNAGIWVHEVGHHRHNEHAASGPGYKDNLHDSQRNTVVGDANWEALWYDAPANKPAHLTAQQFKERSWHWDRRCIMSYANGAPQYFCGKCVLRNRGWTVTNPEMPASDVTEPA